ncbi:uncharacterized protein TNCV_2727731 [Trichonephila clavipes]|nr:uncharacterized protein TNCV_2727731 [Trichonephila clavipes]
MLNGLLHSNDYDGRRVTLAIRVLLPTPHSRLGQAFAIVPNYPAISRNGYQIWIAHLEMCQSQSFHSPKLLSDEAHFWLNGYVNKQNCRIWVKLIHKCMSETPLHPEKRLGALYGLVESLELWFQQDGATCHIARATIDLLKDTFGDRPNFAFGPGNWPPRACDLTPLDYFLWGYVKSWVYADKPQTLDHFEDNIRRVIVDIRPQMLEK